VDVREDGFAQGEAPTAGLDQLTLSWAAPIEIDANKLKDRRLVRLIESTKASWTSGSEKVVPDFGAHPDTGFPPGSKTGRQLLGAMVEGKFTSFFAGQPSPLAKDAKPEDAKDKAAGDKNASTAKDQKPSITGVIDHSAESARLILLGSSSFLSDDVLSLLSEADRTQYLVPLSFAQNLVDWSLEDRGLLALRSRGGQFSRTLSPLSAGGRMLWEYLNYFLALLGLGFVYLIYRAARSHARRHYLEMLGAGGA
jgi:ABC-2 type transport system permease protein